MRRLAVLAFGLILACLTAGSSYADQIGYTLDASVNFSPTGASGTVDPFAGFLDEADAICLAGTCDLEAPQDWLVVTVTVTSGSVNDVGFGALFANAVGVGYFTQGGLPQDGTSGQDTYTGSIANPSVPVITFLANGGGAGLTGTSLPLFAAYADGALPSSLGPGSTNFMITSYGGAGAQTANGTVTTPINIVPEPGTVLLLGGGLLLLATGTRRRSN